MKYKKIFMEEELATEVKPTDNFYIPFKQGFLNILGEEEAKTHGRTNRLYYPSSRVGLYFVPLENLKNLLEKLGGELGFFYRNLDAHTEARETLTGKLKIRRRLFQQIGIKRTATFSRDEYGLIKKYSKLI